jgi:hypothetical protein
MVTHPSAVSPRFFLQTALPVTQVAVTGTGVSSPQVATTVLVHTFASATTTFDSFLTRLMPVTPVEIPLWVSTVLAPTSQVLTVRGVQWEPRMLATFGMLLASSSLLVEHVI